ncbi:trichohyalin [Drosophila kikkawai]|uniref:Trichohyalin n=1 Tax=Drosophila kikkawai TaxID=30033 RepID=A0A6P4IM62_DROKI|nr:trichohyalin [Drosophila kikkawai]XP_017023862.1 trichohyalin [Drosophila kikkawai]
MSRMEGTVYGAFDDPGVSIFATDAQEPIPNMLTYMKPMPRKSCDQDMDACPMIRQASVSDRPLYRQVKAQVEEAAAERHKSILSQQRQRREQIDHDITKGLADELHRQQVAASRCLQIHRNVPEMRNLEVEVERAQTALITKEMILNVERQTAEDKQRERAEALAAQRAVEQERLEELQQRLQKRRAYGNALMSQISESRSNRLRDQRTANEEGRRELRQCEEKVAQERNEDAVNKARQRQMLLEAQRQSEAMLRATREANATWQNRQGKERGILDSLGPMTDHFVSAARKRKLDQMKARETTAARLGFEISRIQQDQEARDQLIINLGIGEFEAREYELGMERARNKLPRKREIRDQLLDHREEQKFFRDKAVQEALNRPKDPTCFGERQYRTQVEQQESHKRLVGHYCRDIWMKELEDKERKARDAEDERRIIQSIYDRQDQQDAFVASERMKLLASQPADVLRAIKPSCLTEAELKAFNLKK